MYAVILEDNDEFAAMRAKYMAQHLAFLEAHADEIMTAGPLTDTADGTPAGGLWLVKANSRQEVCSLLHADPFWPTGLRKSFRILEWKQVFKDGSRQV